jgi:hypothetical protein
MGSYFPDFAMRVLPASFGMNGSNDSVFVNVSVPAVKLYSDTAIFSVTVTPTPPTGTITLTLLNKATNTVQNTLTTYPDSLRLRIKTAGGVPDGLYTVRVQGNGPNGTPVHERFVAVNVGFVGIVNNPVIPKEFGLSQNYPNPFNPSTKIIYEIPKQSHVKLVVYDILGKEVSTLVDKQTNAGSYEVQWNASQMPSGIYFYKITVRQAGSLTGDFVSIKKMILVK